MDIADRFTLVDPHALADRRSRAVMERLGMQESPAEAINHPRLPASSPLRPHCLYRLARARWAATANPP